MATAAKLAPVLTLRTLPEEVSSYKNIEDTFPTIFRDGKELLADLAGKIQLMRLENEIFPNLRNESSKTEIKEKECFYEEYRDRISSYRETLQSVNGQIERAIELCAKVPARDVRSFVLDETPLKVYDYCQRILPTLHDWSIQGTLLDKRFMLVMTSDYKHFEDSITKFKATVNPSSSFLGGIASSVSSLLFGAQASGLEEKMGALSTDASSAEATAAEKKK